jgi:hypothetical protein
MPPLPLPGKDDNVRKYLRNLSCAVGVALRNALCFLAP